MLRRFVSIIALLLTVVWLPAAQHCELEAVGWLSEGVADESGCCTPIAGCAQDACEVVENGGYQPSVPTVKVAAPALFALEWVSPAVACPSLALDLSAVRVRLDEPSDWVPAWQFVRRAAPSPRAPSA